MVETVLELKNVSKYYQKQAAIKDINLEIQQGEIIGIAGPNGAGKTTLLKIISGLTPNYQGSLTLYQSKNTKELLTARQQLGALIEGPAFFPNLTAKQNLKYFAMQRNTTEEGRIDEVLDLVHLSHTANKKFKSFSLGMKQRLGIALALIHRPKLLILDEPINGLDPEGIIQLRHLFKSLSENSQTTLIISSHILSELESIATRFLIIDQGQMIEQFTHSELMERKKPVINIQTNDLDRTVSLIKDHFPTIKIGTTEKTIQLFDFDGIEPYQINEMMVRQGLQVHAFYHQIYPLEELFVDIISKNRGQNISAASLVEPTEM